MTDNPMSDLTPEQQAKAVNIAKTIQEGIARRDAKAGAIDTRKERVEQTWSADARKTRDVIRKGGHTSLPVLARTLIPFIGERADKHELEAALDGFLVANRVYFETEALPVKVIDWMGAPNGIVSVAPGAKVPEHKQALVDAWHRLLRSVNHLSKVGILKPQKLLLNNPTTIELLADLDETPKPTLTAWD